MQEFYEMLEREYIKGIIHVGASDGYEIPFYRKWDIENILAIEPIPHVFDRMKPLLSEKIKAYNIALGNFDGTSSFNIYRDDEYTQHQQSSILEINPDHPDYKIYDIVKKIEVPVLKFKTFVKEYNIDTSLYDVLSIDVQGYEFEVIKGFEEYISNFKYICAEGGTVPVYAGTPTIDVIADYLSNYGFKQLTKSPEHGDIIFER